MREMMIRRLLVIVLCASGVVALWIVADRSLPTPEAAYSALPETTSRSGPSPAPSPSPRPSPRSSGSAAAVRGMRVVQADHDSITIRWNPVRSSPAVAYYTVTLNGLPAGETAGQELTINWFNDDLSGPHFILVRAVDRDGNQGLPGNPLVVERPTVAPTSAGSAKN